MDVWVNHRELHICSKTIKDSFILFFCQGMPKGEEYGVRIFL